MTILQPVLQPVLRPLLADPLAPGFGDGLTAAVQTLFASGEKGVMFDFTRASNLYQDSARTTAVAATNDQIGSVTDLSPNAKHATSAGTARPKWDASGFATWDAFDDYMQTAAIDFSATDAITAIVSVRKLSDAARGFLVNQNSLSNSSFSILAPSTASANYASTTTGTGQLLAQTASSYAAPNTSVITLEGKIATDLLRTRINGADAATAAGDAGTGNLVNDVLVIGARTTISQFLNGRIYRMLVIGRSLTATERNAAERWAAQPVGIAIP